MVGGEQIENQYTHTTYRSISVADGDLSPDPDKKEASKRARPKPCPAH